MQGDLILVIDMQNAYAEGGVWQCRGVEQCSANICRILENVKDEKVLLTKYVAPDNPVGVWKDYNEINREVNEDSFANELMPEYLPYVEKYPCIDKDTYSAAYNKQVRDAAKAAKRVVLTGVVAECCVLATAMSLIDMGCYVVYIKDAVAGISRRTCDATELVLRGLDYVHTKIMTTDEYVKE